MSLSNLRGEYARIAQSAELLAQALAIAALASGLV